MGFSRRFAPRSGISFGIRLGGMARSLCDTLAQGTGRGLVIAGFSLAGLAFSAPAMAQAASCAQLEASLASLDRGAGSWAARQSSIARQRAELANLTSRARAMGCDKPRGFLIFQGPSRPPQCDQIDDQISRLRSSIAGQEQGSSSQANQRKALILALAQNNCGQQYTNAVRRNAPAQPQRPRNFLESIFGTPMQNAPEEAMPDVDLSAVDTSRRSGGSRTVCVRTCDGFFFPLSTGSNPSRYFSEEQLCQRLCPAAETHLYTYSGGDIRTGVNMNGESYMSLPNALRYRKELVQDCSCRTPGQSWAQALQGIEDQTTLRKGDILVTEQQAREMSQPKLTPQQAEKAEKEQLDRHGSITATASAPLAPAAEQPGQRPVRIIPLPRSRNAQQKPEPFGETDQTDSETTD
ncbi:DUF2865 domain-containing protein [Xanthobacter sp. TB0139]|uniref:DUF2865 domain-containing protein n=1 Tax=Xanthobacter sp. TB0139 TaxID=3459178 RepID=UPI00403924D1